MKKNYILALALSLSSLMMVGQTKNFGKQVSPHPSARKISTSTSNNKVNSTAKVQNGPFQVLVSPIVDMLNYRGNLANTVNYSAPIFQDSAVKIIYTNGIGYAFNHMVGNVLDPKSNIFSDPSTLENLLSASDSYQVDTVVVACSYEKVTPGIDTLYLMLAWGDTTNTSVFYKSTPALWIAPINAFSSTKFSPLLSTSNVGGNTFDLSATMPTTNKRIIKYPLENTDTVAVGATYFKYISIPIPNGQTVPANNLFSASIKFVPSYTYSLGDILVDYTTNTTYKNNFNAIYKRQTVLANDLSDCQNYMADLDGKNVAIDYTNDVRYNQYPTTWSKRPLPNFVNGYIMYFSIQGTSTVGVDELGVKGFELGQNMPNPFTKQTAINYNLVKEAKSVNFNVYDVTGRLMHSESLNSVSAGKHQITLNASNFTAGVYYYSLNVDGKVSTKKMIVE